MNDGKKLIKLREYWPHYMNLDNSPREIEISAEERDWERVVPWAPNWVREGYRIEKHAYKDGDKSYLMAVNPRRPEKDSWVIGIFL